jgi:hypothetical protein
MQDGELHSHLGLGLVLWLQFFQLLSTERSSSAGGLPLWVEPEAQEDPETKRTTRMETFVPSPKWLFDIYPDKGRKGFWGGDAPSVVGGHLIDMGGHAQMPKRFALKMLKWYVTPFCSASEPGLQLHDPGLVPLRRVEQG